MSDISKNLGLSVEYLRKARGFTQDQLSKISGIPRATLSHIESGQGNPSVTTLNKLALSLGVPFEELLIAPKASCILTKSSELKKVRRAQGQGIVAELLPRPIPGFQFERLEFQQNGLILGSPHTKGTREYFTCTRGRIAVTIEGEKFILEEGDVLAFPGDRKHSYHNVGESQSEGISIVALHFTD